MKWSQPEVLIDDLYFPECLRWREDRLWFSDMFAGKVYNASVGAKGDLDLVCDLDDLSAGLGWLPDGTLLVVSMNQREVLQVDTETYEVTQHADLSAFFEYPTNDMLVTESGRAYVTGFGFDADHGAPAETVELAVVEPNGRSYLSGSPMVFPNGIDTWDESSGFVVAETYADRLSTVPTRHDGSLEEATVFANLPDGDGPDGISCDDQGGVWVGCAFGQRAVHINREGQIDVEIPVPDRGVYDCLLAGPNRRTLLLGIASTDEPYAAKHKTGSILAVQLIDD